MLFFWMSLLTFQGSGEQCCRLEFRAIGSVGGGAQFRVDLVLGFGVVGKEFPCSRFPCCIRGSQLKLAAVLFGRHPTRVPRSASSRVYLCGSSHHDKDHC